MKKNRSFWWVYKRTSFILLTLFLIFAFSFLYTTDSTYGINKTVGWTWDFTNFTFWISILSTITIVLFIIALVSFAVKAIFFKRT